MSSFFVMLYLPFKVQNNLNIIIERFQPFYNYIHLNVKPKMGNATFFDYSILEIFTLKQPCMFGCHFRKINFLSIVLKLGFERNFVGFDVQHFVVAHKPFVC